MQELEAHEITSKQACFHVSKVQQNRRSRVFSPFSTYFYPPYGLEKDIEECSEISSDSVVDVNKGS